MEVITTHCLLYHIHAVKLSIAFNSVYAVPFLKDGQKQVFLGMASNLSYVKKVYKKNHTYVHKTKHLYFIYFKNLVRNKNMFLTLSLRISKHKNGMNKNKDENKWEIQKSFILTQFLNCLLKTEKY